MINSRGIDALTPTAAAKCRSFIHECALAGIEVLITSTYRDNESQAALYAQGRTVPGHIVTNAKPGRSFHNYRIAFDFVPVKNGKACWGDTALFFTCGAIAKAQGLEWAGDWIDFPEYAHCQDSGGLTITQLQAAQAPAGSPKKAAV